jgi:hypothetical protein
MSRIDLSKLPKELSDMIRDMHDNLDFNNFIETYNRNYPYSSAANLAASEDVLIGFDSNNNPMYVPLKTVDNNWIDPLYDMNKLEYLVYKTGFNTVLEKRGGMKNQKVKKCEKKKVVLGKERCIYKVSGSKKDYMKYKGKLVAVSDYVKSMKKKN